MAEAGVAALQLQAEECRGPSATPRKRGAGRPLPCGSRGAWPRRTLTVASRLRGRNDLFQAVTAAGETSVAVAVLLPRAHSALSGSAVIS